MCSSDLSILEQMACGKNAAPVRQDAAIVLSCLLILSGFTGTQAVRFSLRRTQVTTPSDNDVSFKIVKETLPVKKQSSNCLCEMGSFWHWRIKKCIPQGPWGYECGFFPLEHHHRVCQDGLKCQTLPGTSVDYHDHGPDGKEESFPATCVPCTKGDKCMTGQKRHDSECIKQYSIDGDQACVTVEVTIKNVDYTAIASASHTATAEVTAKKTASASASAEAQQIGRASCRERV